MENNLDLVKLLKTKRIKVIEIPKWGTYLRKRWEDHFVHHLSNEEKQSIYLYGDRWSAGYLWHVFSYERRKSLKEEKADRAFNSINKNGCFVFYQHSDDAYILENAKALSADDFSNEEDVYVVDKEFNWTYVVTHEKGYCGPYFSEK